MLNRSLSILIALACSGTPILAQDLDPKYQVKLLTIDANEGIAAGDVDGDGKPDLVAGRNWYRGGDWAPRPLRSIADWNGYVESNGDYLLDVNGDGRLDVIAGSFTPTEIHWYENPGAGNYDIAAWSVHRLVDTGTAHNEATFLHDIDDDGTPEFIENSWNAKNPTQIFKFVKDPDGKVNVERHVVSESGNGHGMGFGDLNGDGKQDIVFQAGWYQQPAEGAFSGPWKYHHDFDLPHASCPILIVDLNDDGRNDLVWADGHSYGLYWHEQLAPQADGTTTWRQHMIDKKFSQGHALAWDDVDNDGQPELITGKRYYAHSGRDAGAQDEITVQFYDWNPTNQTWTKRLISTATAGEGPGIGLQIRVADLDNNGWKDLILPGKSGTHIIWNDGK